MAQYIGTGPELMPEAGPVPVFKEGQMAYYIPDRELWEIQARARRVQQNGTTSGAARRLADDALRLTTIMLANRVRRPARRTA